MLLSRRKCCKRLTKGCGTPDAEAYPLSASSRHDVLNDTALLASVTTFHLAAAFLRRHRRGNRVVDPFVLPSFCFAAAPWLWPSATGLVAAALAHAAWFIACEVIAPPIAAPAVARSITTRTPPEGPSRRTAAAVSTTPPARGSEGGFVQAPVLAVLDEADGIKTFRLARPAGFEFVPGQFVTVRVSIAGHPHVRCYSISSSPDTRAYLEISVRRQGLVSTTLHATARSGSFLTIGWPAGQFVYPSDDDRPLALIAGGIGITPLLSMLRHAVSSDPTRPVSLLYSARTIAAAAFVNELKVIAERHPQARIGLTLSESEPDGRWRIGHIDTPMMRQYVAHPQHTVFCICGPTPMMDAMRQLLLSEGVPAEQIRSEHFETAIAAAQLNVRSAACQPAAAGRAAPTSYRVAFAVSGRTATVTASQTLLDVADAAGVPIPSSCRAGVCQTCRTRLSEGEADCQSSMLDPSDRDAGFVLPCVTWATSDCVLEA
jgi:ferredoxin-NADP reductase